MHILKRIAFINLIAVTILHLAACSFPSGQTSVAKKNQLVESDQQHTLLTDHQTHKLLQQWVARGYATKFPNQKIILENNHNYGQSFEKIISGFSVSAFPSCSKGIGLPVVVQTGKGMFKPITKTAFQSNLYPGTLVATRAPKGDIQLSLFDPRDHNQYLGKTLRTQHNIVINHVLNDPNNHALQFLGLINPQKFEKNQGFYLSRPYDKTKIPLIMIHGIFSSPKTFMDMAERIESESDLYAKYQIWHYYYPTGKPWLATAHEFRTSFRELIQKLDPQRSHNNLRKSIIVAHSMGGLITRLSLSDPKDHLYKAYLGKQGAKVLTKDQYKKIQTFFDYKPLTEPKQVIFMAVPHRGSKMASGFIGWCTDKFIAIPNTLLKETVNVILPRQKSKLPDKTIKLLQEGENAVNQLRPDNPSLLALNKMKLPSHLKVHSLIGDIGLPAIRFYTDGVVTYRSANLYNTGTETLIPSNHDITDDPVSVRRVMQILRQN